MNDPLQNCCCQCGNLARFLQKWTCLVPQRALCSTNTFCREKYFVQMFDFFCESASCFYAWPLIPKKISFCRNLLLWHFPAFFSIVCTKQVILFARHEFNDVCGRFVYSADPLKTKKRSCQPLFARECPRLDWCRKASLSQTNGMALQFEIWQLEILLQSST